jgi:uridine kinase
VKNIHVTITGTMNSGKSTIGIELRDVLKKAGFDVSLNDDSPLYYTEYQQERLKHIAGTTRVNIHCVTERRFRS